MRARPLSSSSFGVLPRSRRSSARSSSALFVDLLEDFAHGVFGGVAVDAGLPDLLHDARPPAMLDGAFHARHGEGDAAIVQRAVGFQTRNGGVDVVGVEARAV